MSYLAAPLLLFLYAVWKVYSWFAVPEHRPLYIKIKDIDIYTGMRDGQRQNISGMEVSEEQRRASLQEMEAEKRKGGVMGWIKAGVRNVI